MSNLLAPLTAAQRQAVLHVDGPLLILAGPGSGKTRTVTHRIAYLLEQGIPASQILALTFTNKAAKEMQLRLERLAPGQPVWAGTFHRFCARLLRQYAERVGLEPNYTIYDTDDSHAALKRTLTALDFHDPHLPLERIAHWISTAKNSLVRPDQFQARPGILEDSLLGDIYPAYCRRLLAANAVDFDDLLLHVALLLRDQSSLRETLDARHRYILVDEYQDTNLAQYAIVRALSLNFPNLCATGDPDQSIYGWRGATLRNILEFERDYPRVRVVRLEQNYRSTQRIVRAADTLIQRNQRRKHKTLYTENAEGKPIRVVEYMTHELEAQGIAQRIANDLREGLRRASDFAVFYRVNALSRNVELALRAARVPYQIIRGVEFFQRKEIKLVLAYLQLLNNPRDEGAFLRVVNVPPRNIGEKSLARLQAFARERGLSLWEAARSSRLIGDLKKPAVAAFAGFVALLDRLAEFATQPVEAVLGKVLSETDYPRYLQEQNDDPEHDRLANLEELLTQARSFDAQRNGHGSLEAFLEEVSLVNETDDLAEGSEKVSLMSLHASKGLEFPVVFLTAVEEGLLPHAGSDQRADRLEEERRLLFVGMTRAQEELELSYARYRNFRGRRGTTVPSSFLLELPREELELVHPEPPPGFGRGSSEVADFAPSYDGLDELPADEVYEDSAPPATAAKKAKRARPEFDEAAPDFFPDESGADEFEPVRPRSALDAIDAFAHRMTVRHPQYGLGKITALSGEGKWRKATVRFASELEITFVLAQSPLVPVRDADL